MKLDRYTTKVQGFIQSSHEKALKLTHQSISVLHLLQVMLEDTEIQFFLQKLEKNANTIKEQVESISDKIPKVTSSSGQMYIADDLRRTLLKAEELADKNNDAYITQEFLIFAIMITPNTPVFDLFNGVSENKIWEVIQKMRKGQKATSESAEEGFEALDKYCINLTKQAREGKLDPIIGREEEIRRTIQVLSRRTKNNPVLIGEPGVGKTAILEGLAQRIVHNDVPVSLQNMELMSLDLGSLLAGAKFRGDFEERLKAVLKEITSSETSIVLFIDELHTLVGAGKTDGAMDASNMLKPALARGELHCVGATTLDEYRQYIEKDAALARRFQPVYVKEPTVEDTISILRGIKEKYEMHHAIHISDEAIISAATLSNRYITDRFLPDKAIDLVDEAASALRMEIDSKPVALDRIDRKIMQLKIEKEALKKDTNPETKERLAKIESQLTDLEKESSAETQKWESSNKLRFQINETKERLEKIRTDLEGAERKGDLALAGQLKYGEIPSLEGKLQELTSTAGVSKRDVTSEDIAAIVSRWTGIPLDKMLAGQQETLLKLEDSLRSRVVGQEAAIAAVANAVRRSRSGLQDPNRPLASFLFLGPTGVGKTELAKTLASFLFDDDQAMTRIDMSEFMERHSVARLIGAPPGYVGYEEGGALTEAVRRRPYQIILFDEVEKAHSDVFNILLQVLDDGILTDSQGRTVDFKNTILILTSNIGSEVIAGWPSDQPIEDARNKIMEIVGHHFRPEFINRLDEILIFDRLKKEAMRGILDIQLKRLQKRLDERKITLTLTEAAADWLSEVGFDPVYGARPLKRAIQKYIQDPLASKLLAGEIKDGHQLIVDSQGKELTINFKQ